MSDTTTAIRKKKKNHLLTEKNKIKLEVVCVCCVKGLCFYLLILGFRSFVAFPLSSFWKHIFAGRISSMMIHPKKKKRSKAFLSLECTLLRLEIKKNTSIFCLHKQEKKKKETFQTSSFVFSLFVDDLNFLSFFFSLADIKSSGIYDEH